MYTPLARVFKAIELVFYVHWLDVEIAKSKTGSRPWPAGPWDTEPNYVSFKHLNYPCLLIRNDMGSWCGYVGVQEGHPFYQQSDPDVSIHGGVTFAARCHGIHCHVPDVDEPGHRWWIGFDCCHLEDLMPSGITYTSARRYWTIEEVRRETERLAEQCRAATKGT